MYTTRFKEIYEYSEYSHFRTGISSPKIYYKLKNYAHKRWYKYPYQLVKIDQSIMKFQTKARVELLTRGTIFTLHYNNSQVSIYI